jgi:ketosteroid isomerase-like protein
VYFEEFTMPHNSFFSGLVSCIALPLRSQWMATTPAAEVSVHAPRIAAALEAATRFDQAILAKDIATFESLFSDNAVVNNPYHRIARKQDAVNNLKNGMIDYTSLERSVEYAALRGEHEVLLMGEEAVTPVGKAKCAGLQVRRRTTEVWTDATGVWQLSLRQATIYSAE